jgi:hypothetical protein
MKLVLQTVLREVELAPAPTSSGTQRATRSSVAFAPCEALAVIRRRRPGRDRAGDPNGARSRTDPAPVG